MGLRSNNNNYHTLTEKVTITNSYILLKKTVIAVRGVMARISLFYSLILYLLLRKFRYKRKRFQRPVRVNVSNKFVVRLYRAQLCRRFRIFGKSDGIWTRVQNAQDRSGRRCGGRRMFVAAQPRAVRHVAEDEQRIARWQEQAIWRLR